MRLPAFLKDVATLAGGKGVATVISMLTMPIVSRLFHPDVYGVAALYISTLTILTTIGTFSFPQAIVLPKNDKKSSELFFLSLISLVICALIAWAILTIVWLASGSPYPVMGYWLWTLPIAMVFFGLQQATENWLTRGRKFKISAAGDIGQTATTVSVRILSGLQFGSALWPLITGYLLGLAARLFLYKKIYPSVITAVKGVTTNSLISTAREFRQFPFYNMPAALTFSINAQLPVLFIGFLFLASDVGHYAMVQGLLVTTTMMVGESVRRVYLHRISQQEFTASELRADYRKIILIMASVAIIPAAILIAYGEPLFAMLLGDEWADAGRYAAILAPWFYIQWLSMPASALVIRLKKQRFWLIFQQTILWCQLVAMIIGYTVVGTVSAVLLGYVISRIALLLFLILRAYSMIIEVKPIANKLDRI